MTPSFLSARGEGQQNMWSSKASIILMLKALKRKHRIRRYVMKNRLVIDGGPDSGFFNHSGISGQIGGSALPGQGGGSASSSSAPTVTSPTGPSPGVPRKAGHVYELKELNPNDIIELEHPAYRSLDNLAARKWYVAADEKIPDLIDRSRPLEDQARQACSQRIWNRGGNRGSQRRR